MFVQQFKPQSFISARKRIFLIIVNKGMDSFLRSFISTGGVREFSHRH